MPTMRGRPATSALRWRASAQLRAARPCHNDMTHRPKPPTDDEAPFWRRKAMKDMTKAEWESLCDGCGRCCLNKLVEDGSDRTYYTDVGCRLLDGTTCRC